MTLLMLDRVNRARLALAALLVFAACRADVTSPLTGAGEPARTFSIAVDQEVEITLSTVGPGSFDAPPVIVGSAISFLQVTYPGPFYPSGATQLFHFKGVGRGEAIIQFHRPGPLPRDVIDTVVVR